MTALANLAVWLRRCSGWRRIGIAFAAGAVSATGFAPLEFFPALLLGFAALVLLIDGADVSAHPVRNAALAGWAFCFGQFLIGWHWIGYAFMVDPGAHLWQMPFALVFLTAGLALYGGLAAGLSAFFWQEGPGRVLTFAVLYAAGEWLRGHLMTGFPWNLPAYGWGVSLAILQSTSLIGSYGLSFLTVALGGALAELGDRRWRLPAAMAALFLGLWVFGTIRLAAAPPPDVPGVRLRLVQPNVPQREKYVRGLMRRNWQRLIDLSSQPGADGKQPTHIIWPEAATGFAVARAPAALDEIAILTGPDKTLMTGSEALDRGVDGLDFYNSLYLFGPGGAPLGRFDKFHLVPFGEYVPFAHILNRFGITKLTVGEAGFSEGDGPHGFVVPGAPRVAPLICYEIIFPGAVIARHEARPGWIVNVTDDSWFGPWAGPYQHLLTAQIRAIEEGLPVARAANTGISAVIDSNGRLRASLALNNQGVVDAPLPGMLTKSLYASFGDLILLLLLIAGIVISWVLKTR